MFTTYDESYASREPRVCLHLVLASALRRYTDKTKIAEAHNCNHNILTLNIDDVGRRKRVFPKELGIPGSGGYKNGDLKKENLGYFGSFDSFIILP